MKKSLLTVLVLVGFVIGLASAGCQTPIGGASGSDGHAGHSH